MPKTSNDSNNFYLFLMQRILYEIFNSDYYPVKFQDILHVPYILEKWKYRCCYQTFGYLPNNPAYADEDGK